MQCYGGGEGLYLSHPKSYQIKILLSAYFKLNLGLVWYFPGGGGGGCVVLDETKANCQLELSLAKMKAV